MNFLANGGYFARFNRITYLTVPCDLKRVILTPTDSHKPDLLKPALPRATNTEDLRKRLCVGRLRMSSGPGFTTQIRWSCENKQYPTFNRDLEYPNFDFYRKKQFRDVRKTECDQGDDKKGYTYTIAWMGYLAAAYAVKSHSRHYIMAMSASADVLAVATVEVNLSAIDEGRTITVKWRGKPLFIKHRTQQEIENERATPLNLLKHVQKDEERAQKPEWLIVIGICTHLGCVPIPDSGDFPGGFYCPCHGSHYDAAGRARKGPAPLNLELPPYRYVSDDLVLIG